MCYYTYTRRFAIIGDTKYICKDIYKVCLNGKIIESPVIAMDDLYIIGGMRMDNNEMTMLCQYRCEDQTYLRGIKNNINYDCIVVNKYLHSTNSDYIGRRYIKVYSIIGEVGSNFTYLMGVVLGS